MPTFGQRAPTGNPLQDALLTIQDAVNGVGGPGVSTPASPDWNTAAPASAAPAGPEVGASAAAAQKALADLNRPDWKPVGAPSKDAAGKYTWSVVGPTGEADVMTLAADGTIDTPPTKTPGRPPAQTSAGAAKDATPWQDSSGKWWVNNPDDPANPKAVNGPTVGTAKQQPAPISDYEKESLKLQGARDTKAAAAQQATQSAEATRLEISRQADANTKAYQEGQLGEAAYRDKMAALNQQATIELNRAQLAVTAARDAQQAWVDQQNVKDRQSQLAQTAKQNEATNEQAMLSTMANVRNSDQQSRQQGAATGAGILNNATSQASGMLQNTVNQAASSKNIGLGTQLPADWGQGLVSGITNWTQEMAGGPDVMRTAANLVKNANPEVASGPGGPTVVAQLAQMLQMYKQAAGGPHPVDQAQNAPAPGADNAPTAAGGHTFNFNFAPGGYQGAPNPNVFGSAPDSVPFTPGAA